MATGPKYVQDMPPEGGYSRISFKRIPARTFFSGYQLIAGFIGMTVGSMYLYALTYEKVKKEEIEMRSARIVLDSLLLAERDRAYLKQLRKNYEEEEKLMANVEGWEVGTLYGERLYKTIPEDTLIDPDIISYYAHAPYKSAALRMYHALWT